MIFLRISLIEAYNSVYNYDVIGIVENHHDSTDDEERLSLDSYTFIKEGHLQNVERGGVGLYIKVSLASKNLSVIVIHPECVVFEIQFNKKKYFIAVIYGSPSQSPEEFDSFAINFELNCFLICFPIFINMMSGKPVKVPFS